MYNFITDKSVRPTQCKKKARPEGRASGGITNVDGKSNESAVYLLPVSIRETLLRIKFERFSPLRSPFDKSAKSII